MSNFKTMLASLFEPEPHQKNLWLVVGWILFMYSIGLLLWGIFFDWRHTALNYHDWAQINLPRIQVVKDALKAAQLPLHVTDQTFLHSLTDRFLALPDVITTPQMALLYWIDGDTFVLLDVLLHYTIATAGLIYFARRYKLSLFVYAVLFFLYNFNGYIQAHYAVGHVTWGGYFLFPWFLVLLFDFTERQANWRWVSKIALLSFYVILTGGQHHFTWMMLFLSIFGLTQIKQLKWVWAAIFASAFLSAVRLLPPVLIVNTVTSKSAFQFRAGYPGLFSLLDALINIRPINYDLGAANIVTGYWEYDYFIGLLGLALLIFGVWAWLRDPKRPFTGLLLPSGLLILLSMGFLYEQTLYHLPVFASERVISRMVSLPLTFLLMVSSLYWQKACGKIHDALGYSLAGFGFLFLLNDLFTHTRLWSVKKMAQVFPATRLQFPNSFIQNHADPEYIQLLIMASVLSLLTAGILTALVLLEKKRAVSNHP